MKLEEILDNQQNYELGKASLVITSFQSSTKQLV